jgi:hypothetical protein
MTSIVYTNEVQSKFLYILSYLCYQIPHPLSTFEFFFFSTTYIIDIY